jgi:hypothetical protein
MYTSKNQIKLTEEFFSIIIWLKIKSVYMHIYSYPRIWIQDLFYLICTQYKRKEVLLHYASAITLIHVIVNSNYRQLGTIHKHLITQVKYLLVLQ